MKYIIVGLVLLCLGAGGVFWYWQNTRRVAQEVQQELSRQPRQTEDEWRRKLSPEAYTILREGATEAPFSSTLNTEKRSGTYVAADTGEPVFRSEDKFDSGTGWPSFTRPIRPEAVIEHRDDSFFMERTEVLTTAGGHLGHVFNDGPPPTGRRYCMNGAALRFVPDVE